MSVFKSENFSFRIAFSFLLLILPVGIGLAGYMLIEKYGFLDALYMSVITIATVGYGEVIPLSDNGRIFTIFLIITNLGVFAYALSLITSILIQGEFYRKFKKNMMKNKISKLRNHVIVCGYGRNGKEAVAILETEHAKTSKAARGRARSAANTIKKLAAEFKKTSTAEDKAE
jgi:voltage-gated potassium channel